ncbi:MAG: PD40 domain-containing protein, partial [Chloroflexota bacterium]|nr:PD40 domain-containing protein [Chloroflexota bacterium]
MKQVLILLLVAALTVVAVACGAPLTPTPSPSPTSALPTAAPTKPPTPTTARTATPVPPTATPAPPTATPTRTRVPATPKPAATGTPVKPPAPKGSIAFHQNKIGIDSILVFNVETNITTPLVDVGPVIDLVVGTNAAPGAWSPDNSKFAFVQTVSPGSANVLRLLDPKIGTTIPLDSSDSGGGLSSPTWSPDGSRVAYVRLSGNQQAWSIDIVNADGTGHVTLRKVVGEQYRGGLQWSKQGVFAVAFNTTSANDVYSMSADGGSVNNLTKNPADDGSPAWSPDGKQIAFT